MCFDFFFANGFSNISLNPEIVPLAKSQPFITFWQQSEHGVPPRRIWGIFFFPQGDFVLENLGEGRLYGEYIIF